uniref:Uncharacterized protein n=1 Tax=Anguilla anguilla TaxID=7936 RepID=A0A0E9QTY7_ANGAN
MHCKRHAGQVTNPSQGAHTIHSHTPTSNIYSLPRRMEVVLAAKDGPTPH